MRKLLLFPLRISVGWGISPRLLGLIGATMLVLLRLSIGWHFYSEGLDKHQAGNWSAAPFFANAKGPFADHYRDMVWDADGHIRRDLEQSKYLLAVYRDQVVAHYGFDEEQTRAAQAQYSSAINQQSIILDDNRQDLDEYDLGKKRLEELNDDPMRNGVSSLRGQRDTIRKERQDKIKPALASIDQVWKNYSSSLNAIATDDQQDAAGVSEFNKPIGLNTGTIDRFVPYFDIAIGLCLLLGLFTPLAALAGAGFLATVFLSQYPPSTGPTSSNYQLVECMACLVLAGTAAGRFAGLDYFLHLICRKSLVPATDD